MERVAGDRDVDVVIVDRLDTLARPKLLVGQSRRSDET
jgi:hypothetical protein